MTRKKIKNILKFIVSISLIYFIIKKVGVAQFGEDLKNLNLYYLFLAFFFNLVSTFIQAERLRIIVSGQKIKINYLKAYKFNLISTFFGIFLPTVIGGDVIKMALLSSHSGKKAVSVGVVTMDRVIGTYALVVIALVGGIIGRNHLTNVIVLYTIAAFVIVFIAFLTLNIKSIWESFWKFVEPKFGKKFASINIYVQTLQSYGILTTHFLKAFVWSLIFYLAIIMSSYFVSLSLGLNISLLVFFVFVPLLSLASMAPISISGIGVRESVSVIFFSTIGISSSLGVLLSFIPFVLKIMMGLAGGIIYATTGIVGDKVANKKNEITINK